MLGTAIDWTPSTSSEADVPPHDDSLAQTWTACAPVVDDIVRHLYRAGGVVDAADVVQQAALTVVELLRSGRYAREPSEVSLDALRREVKWRIRDFLRSERRRQGRLATADDTVLERALARRAAAPPSGVLPGRALVRAVESLSPRQRAVVAGLYFREANVADLATELQVTPQAVTALHRRALAAMREELGGSGPETTPRTSEC